MSITYDSVCLQARMPTLVTLTTSTGQDGYNHQQFSSDNVGVRCICTLHIYHKRPTEVRRIATEEALLPQLQLLSIASTCSAGFT